MNYMSVKLNLDYLYSGDWFISPKGMCVDIHRLTMDDTPFYYMRLIRKGRYKGIKQPKRK